MQWILILFFYSSFYPFIFKDSFNMYACIIIILLFSITSRGVEFRTSYLISWSLRVYFFYVSWVMFHVGHNLYTITIVLFSCENIFAKELCTIDFFLFRLSSIRYKVTRKILKYRFCSVLEFFYYLILDNIEQIYLKRKVTLVNSIIMRYVNAPFVSWNIFHVCQFTSGHSLSLRYLWNPMFVVIISLSLRYLWNPMIVVNHFFVIMLFMKFNDGRTTIDLKINKKIVILALKYTHYINYLIITLN